MTWTINFGVCICSSRTGCLRPQRDSSLHWTQSPSLNHFYLTTPIMAILSESFLSIGTTQNFVAVAILLVTARLTQLYFTTLRYPSNLPRVYEDPKATSFRWKTRLTYFTDCQNMFREAYEKVAPSLPISQSMSLSTISNHQMFS